MIIMFEKIKKLFRSRSAETGRFVSKDEATKNPAKTVSETYLQKSNVNLLVAKLQTYQFRDEFGYPLENCAEFKKLVELAKKR